MISIVMNWIKEQYGQLSGAEVNYGGNSSPVGSVASSDNSNDDQVQKLQQQVSMLQREVRRLHNRHRELHSEIERLRREQ
jgi:predicted RNase H-like nuclease (RuvC/YqgF family)